MACRATWALVSSASVAILAACGGGQAPAPPPEPVAVVTLVVHPREVPMVREFVGQTESSQQVEIRARVDGFLEKRAYTEGTKVRAGQVLFLMDRKPFEASLRSATAELELQQARLTTARAALARVRPLVEDNALAAKDLDDAVGSEQAAAAAVAAAQAKVVNARLNLGYTTITSPVSGLSSFAKVQDGAYINSQNSLLTYVARLDPMRVNFSLSENDTLQLRADMAGGRVKPSPDGRYPIDVVMADGSVFPQQGRITFTDAAFSQSTGTFLVRADLPNPKGQLLPGQFVRVKVHGFTRPAAILVPQAAVQEGARGSFVWIVGPDGKVAQRAVRAGPWQGDDWVIEEGLKDGERVVTSGVMKLAPGVPVKETAAGGARP